MTTTYGYRERTAFWLGYRVELETGIVLSPNGNQLKPYITGEGGYPRISVGRFGGQCSVHRLVGYQLWGKAIYQAGMEVRHLDGNVWNWLPGNLALGTKSENAMDKKPEVRRAAAITASQTIQKYDHRDVIAFYKQVGSYRKTMAEFGISSPGTMSFIIRKSMMSQSPALPEHREAA